MSERAMAAADSVVDLRSRASQVNDQAQLLRATASAHERFTELTLAEASAEELVLATAELTGGQVVFANLLHQVLALDARGDSVEDLLARWQRSAQGLGSDYATVVDTGEGLATTPVEVRGQRRGRLTLLTTGGPTPTQVVVLERAAAALAIHLLLEGEDELVARAGRSVFADIVAPRWSSADSIHARAAAIGHPTRHRRYLPVVVVGHGDAPLAEPVRQALADTRLDALQGPLVQGRWGVLLLLRHGQGDHDVEAFATRLHRVVGSIGLPRVTVGLGVVVSELRHVRGSFTEAVDVALAALVGEDSSDEIRPCHRIQDIQLRGLLYTLRHEPRVQAFVERTLGPLLARDARDGGDLVRSLAVYLKFRGNKSLAAQELGISRPTLYERLARIQRLLQTDLDDPEATTSLYAAIMVVQAMPAGSPLAMA